MRFIKFKGSTDLLDIVNAPKDALDRDIQLDAVHMKFNDDDASVTICGELNKEEIDQINKTGKVYIQLPILGEAIGVPNGTLLKPDDIENDDITDVLGNFN